MTRSLTPTQVANTEATATKPIYLVAWEHSGTEELLSASGDITLDGKNYCGGCIDVRRINEGIDATLTVFPTIARVMEVQNGAWREGSCKIYYIPASLGGSATFDLADAILILDGEIDDSQYSSGKITVKAVHTSFTGNYSPRHLVSSVSNHISGAGTTILWEDGVFILEARERAVVRELIEPLTGVVRGRLTASDLQSFVPPAADKYKTVTAEGAFLRLPYGRDSIPGEVFAQAIDGTDLIVGVAWGLGECEAIDRTYINDVATPAGVFVRHYRGKLNQIADPWLAAAITAYSDTMILTEPSGSIGVTYSVFKIPSGVLDSVPTSFKADGRWKHVYDPRNPASGDPHASNAGFSIEFTGADSSTTATDDGASGHTVTLQGDADIQGNQLSLDGTDDCAQVESTELNLADSDHTLEIKATATSLSGTVYLINKGSVAVEGFRVYRQGSALKISMSSNGTSWDIVEAETLYTLLVLVEFLLTIERTGNWFVAYINGDEVWRLYSTATIFETSEWWTIGGREVTSSNWNGTVRVCRLCIGKARYQVPHDATGTPFADNGIYTSTMAYSDNSALCFGDLVTNQIYGLGKTVTGLDDAADWCDELALDGVERCRLSLSLSVPRKTTDYLDLLASYADCIWYNDGSDVFLKADRAIGVNNPSGQNIAIDSAFDDGSDWTLGDGWSVSGGVAVCDGTQVAVSAVEQALTTEVGTQYVASFDLTDYTAGSVSLDFEGVEVIPGKSATGSYRALVTAAGATADLEAIGSSDFEGEIDNLKCERLFYLTTKVVGQSVNLRGLSDKGAPTRVKAQIKDPSDTLGSWGELSIEYSLPGVDLDEAALRPTSLSLPGVFREEEGNNKAHAKLLRSVNRTTCSWVSADDGIVHRKGSVVHLKLDNEGINDYFWIESVITTSAGRYAITAIRYDAAHYPSELLEPANAGTVPVGAIVMLSGTTVPAGWAAYTAADGKYIVGAGDTYSPGNTGGAADYSGFSDNNTPSDGHDDAMETMNVKQPASGGLSKNEYTVQGYATTHVHSYDTGTLTPDLLRRENALIQKTGSSSSKFPVSAMPFGLPGISIPNCARMVSAAGRLLKAATANANLGLANQFVAVTSGNTDFAHMHHLVQSVTNRADALDTQRQVRVPLEGGGVHNHTYNFELVRSVKKNTVALYAGTDDFSVAPGMMVLWAGLIADIPADWYLCDGTNSTQDLTDHFVQISALDGENVSSGDNTLSINADGSIEYHDHDNDTFVDQGTKTINVNHKNQVGHKHPISDSDSWMPEYFALAMIMYNP